MLPPCAAARARARGGKGGPAQGRPLKRFVVGCCSVSRPIKRLSNHQWRRNGAATTYAACRPGARKHSQPQLRKARPHWGQPGEGPPERAAVRGHCRASQSGPTAPRSLDHAVDDEDAPLDREAPRELGLHVGAQAVALGIEVLLQVEARQGAVARDQQRLVRVVAALGLGDRQRRAVKERALLEADDLLVGVVVLAAAVAVRRWWWCE